MRIFTKLFTVALLLAASLTVSAQGVTTASVFGKLTDEKTGEALIGATVQAVHTPSGSTYGNVTDLDGFFRLPGMRVGGPYIITATYVGYEPIVQDGIYLQLGQAFQFSKKMGTDAIDLTGVEVIASRSDVFDGGRTGQETTISEEQIEVLPTVSRSIADFARLNPLAKIDEGGDGLSIEIAGQNNRFNAIYIDGAVNNDAFGLSGSGTNGGQTGVSPISIDAIEQFTVSVAPFDVRQSGFAGGSVSAVTRSGSNNFEGSAYYFFRNENLTRKDGFENEDGFRFNDAAPFTAKTYGARLGGPIVKNKVFFFVNAELQRDETPQPFDIGNYAGESSLADIQSLASFVNETYGYDVGTFDNNPSSLSSDKILAKLDFNLSDKHKLSVRHSYTGAENVEARNSFSRGINFINGSEFFVSNTNSSALELNSIFNNNTANNLTIGATFVRDDRDPLGPDFPTVRINDGDDGTIQFGAERFSTANLLNQDVITIKNDFNIYKGAHNILIGANLEFFSAGNLFIRENFGSYQYFGTDDVTAIEQFRQGLPASRFDRSFSQVDNITGDESGAIAAFNQNLFGIYVQDEWQVNNKLRLTGGIRFDIPVWPTDVPVNEEFNNETIPQLEAAGYDLRGARTGEFIGSALQFAPRIGFNYDVNGDRTFQLRGGIGIFTSRIPLVWPGGAFNNYGLNVGGVRTFDQTVFNPDVNAQAPGNVDLNNLRPSGQIDLFAEDFKLPQTTKVNLAADYKLPCGIIATVEGLYTKFNNYTRYERLDLNPDAQRRLTGSPDNRVYNDGNPFLDTDYTGIYLGSNTDKGYSWNASVVLQKPFSNGFQAQVGYSYGDSYTLFDGTSSQNSSQWRGAYNPEGRNNDPEEIERSTFAAGHRIFGSASYALTTKFTKTTFALFMNGDNVGPYTYVVGAPNFRFVNDGGFSFNEVAFVPADASQINLVDDVNRDGTIAATAAQQWEALDAYIEADPHLSDRRGEFSQRNGAWSPFRTIFDARILHDFYIETGKGHKNTLQFSFDIFNLNNLLNQNWGKRNNLGFNTISLVNLEGISDDGVPSYTVPSDIQNLTPETIWDNDLDVFGIRSSLWSAQVGVRYIFK